MTLRTDSRVWLRRNVNLAQYTTMQVGGPAAFFAEPTCEPELLEALEFARQEGLVSMVLGKGSNIIFPDEGFDGLVICMLHYEKEKIEFHDELYAVNVGGGVHLYRFALAAQHRGYGGAEFLSGIPGTVGGALVMNAGFSRFAGQKNEVGDVVEEVTALYPDGRKEIRTKKDLRFSYRASNLEEVLVLEARFQLWRRPCEEIEKEMKANFEYRNREQDLRYPSSGSIFKNPAPPSPSAGRLIDQQGLKGLQMGGMMVSPKHGNYFVKVGAAKSADVQELIQKVQETVFHATQVFLEPEVRIVKKS